MLKSRKYVIGTGSVADPDPEPDPDPYHFPGSGFVSDITDPDPGREFE